MSGRKIGSFDTKENILSWMIGHSAVTVQSKKSQKFDQFFLFQIVENVLSFITCVTKAFPGDQITTGNVQEVPCQVAIKRCS